MQPARSSTGITRIKTQIVRISGKQRSGWRITSLDACLIGPPDICLMHARRHDGKFLCSNASLPVFPLFYRSGLESSASLRLLSIRVDLVGNPTARCGPQTTALLN